MLFEMSIRYSIWYAVSATVSDMLFENSICHLIWQVNSLQIRYATPADMVGEYLSAILPHVYLTFLPATLPDILT